MVNPNVDKVLFNDEPGTIGRQLSEENLGARNKRNNSSDYVEEGLSFTVDYANNQLDISEGHVVISDSRGFSYDALPVARSDLALTDSTTNEVFCVIDPSLGDSIEYQIITDGSTPSGTSLKIGEVDTSADTYTETNRDPSATFKSTTTDRTDTTLLRTRGHVETELETKSLPRYNGSPKPMAGAAANFEDLTNWSTANADTTLSADTSVVFQGSQSAKLENSGAGADVGVEYSFPTAVDLTNIHPSLALNVSTPLDEDLTIRAIYFDSSGNYVTYERSYNGTNKGQNWEILHPGASYDSSTAPDLTSIDRIQVIVKGASGQLTVNLDSVRFLDGPDKAYFVFSFDDGDGSIYDNAYPLMQKYGFAGCMGIISSAVGESGAAMTLSELREMHANGWEILNHTSTYNSRRTDNVSNEDWETYVREGKEFLLKNGLYNGQSGFIWPRGEYDDDAIDIVDKYHDYAFGVDAVGKGNAPMAYRNHMTIPRGSATDASNVQTKIDTAIQYNQVYFGFLHTVGTTGAELSNSEFESILSHLDSKSRSDIEVVTFSEFVNKIQ